MANVVLESAVTFRDFLGGQEQKHKICSVFPREVYLANSNGSYTLPACVEGKAYTYVEVGCGLERWDHGENRHFVAKSIPAIDMARDFIGHGIHANWTDRGLFVPAGDIPTPAEIDEARDKLRAWLDRQVAAADREFGLRGQARFVDSNARMGVKVLNLDREWASTYTPTPNKQTCPACLEPMKGGAAIHSPNDNKGCGARIAYEDGIPVWADAPPSRPKSAAPVKEPLPGKGQPPKGDAPL